jgi:hypothetical protein
LASSAQRRSGKKESQMEKRNVCAFELRHVTLLASRFCLRQIHLELLLSPLTLAVSDTEAFIKLKSACG